jgi:hypothetical protein
MYVRYVVVPVNCPKAKGLFPTSIEDVILFVSALITETIWLLEFVMYAYGP